MAWWTLIWRGKKQTALNIHKAHDEQEVPSPLTPARQWLESEAGRPFHWRSFTPITVAGSLYIGDPLSGPEALQAATLPEIPSILTPWVFESGEENDLFFAHTNSLIWLEAQGTLPVSKEMLIEFPVDGACIGVFPEIALQALKALDLADQRNGSFEWMIAQISNQSHFASCLNIPPDNVPAFIASTGSDGGFAAVALYDRSNRLSGILVDIAGRAVDQRFIDKQLPERHSIFQP